MNYTELDDGSLMVDMKAKIAEILSQVPCSLRTTKTPFDNSLGSVTSGRGPTCPRGFSKDVELGDLTEVEKWLLKEYSSVVGMVGWPAKMCRPDIAQAFSMLSRALHDPQPQHARFLRQLLAYLQGTNDLALVLRKPSSESCGPMGGSNKCYRQCLHCTYDLVGYSDSNFKDKLDDEWRATTGFCWYYGGILVAWRAKRQDMTLDSTFKVEMLAAHVAFMEGEWLCNLLRKQHLTPDGPVRFYCDNAAVIFTLNKEIEEWKRTHLLPKFFQCRQLIKLGYFDPHHIPGLDNVADIFTKGLSHCEFVKHRLTLGVEPSKFKTMMSLARAAYPHWLLDRFARS
jgi:hypothetical protein